MNPGEMQQRLEEISRHGDVAYGRVHDLFESEKRYGLEVASRFHGYLALSDAFKSFFLETTEAFNSSIRPRIAAPLSEFHAMFLPRLIHAWQSLCGLERLALHGYPLQAYAGLRNVFDGLQTTSAALQGMVDFYATEGVVPGRSLDIHQVRKLRKKTEIEVSQLMAGAKSGLNQATIDELAHWDRMFDFEVHGGRLSFANAQDFMRGKGPLPVYPAFVQRNFAMFMNRYCEIAWMTHRLIPLAQPPGLFFDNEWKDKWRVIDESFLLVSESLSKEVGKPIGAAIVEYVTTKFPFSADSEFPLK
jgi:hypothetical protein